MDTSEITVNSLASKDDLAIINIVNAPDQLDNWSENSIFQHLLQFQEISDIKALYDSMDVTLDDDTQLCVFIRKNGECLLVVDTKDEKSELEWSVRSEMFVMNVGSTEWYVSRKRGISFLATSKELLEFEGIVANDFKSDMWDKSFVRVNSKKLFVNKSLEETRLNEMLNLFTYSTDYSLSFTDDKLNTSGFDFSRDNCLNSLLLGQKPQTFNLSENLILDFNSIKTLFLSSGERLHLANEKSTVYPTSIFDGVQIAEIDFKNEPSDKVMVLKSQKIEELYSICTKREAKKLKSVYGFTIYEVLSDNLIDDLFEGYFSTIAHYAVFRENMMVTASNPKALEEYLGKLSHNQVWFHSYDQMKWVEQELIAMNSMFLYNVASYEADFTAEPRLRNFYENNKDLIRSMPYVLVQQSMESTGVYTGASLTFSEEEQSDVRANVVLEDDSEDDEPKTYTLASFENDLVTKPIAVKNYSTGAVQFLLVDTENVIRSVTNGGRTDWKFKLDGSLVSDIYEIDVFKNKKIQYIFATEKKVYCVDRLGNMVDNFPIYLPSKSLISGFNLIDYNQSRDYRLAVNSGKNIWLYDVKSKVLEGWNPLSLSSNIQGNVKHYRFKTKDYLLALEESGEINVLKRKGVSYNGFSVSEKHSFIANNTTIEKGSNENDSHFGFLSADGMLAKYSLSGDFYTIEKVPLPGKLNNIFVQSKKGNTRYSSSYKNNVYVFDEKQEQKYVLKEGGDLKGFQLYDLSGEEVYVFVFEDYVTVQTSTGKILIDSIPSSNKITLYYSSSNSKGFVYYTSGNELKKQGFEL